MQIPKWAWYTGGGFFALYVLSLNVTTTPGRVDAVRTTLTQAQAKEVLLNALRKALGREPTKAEFNMLLAQSSFETANWKSMFNWNFGNSVIGSATGQWFTLKNDAAEPLALRHHYRVFYSAQEGADYYVNLLKNRFTQAWALLGSGSTAAFAQALKNKNYYEAPVSSYAAGLSARYGLA